MDLGDLPALGLPKIALNWAPGLKDPMLSKYRPKLKKLIITTSPVSRLFDKRNCNLWSIL